MLLRKHKQTTKADEKVKRFVGMEFGRGDENNNICIAALLIIFYKI